MSMHPTFISHLKYQYSFFAWNTNISPLPQSTNENKGVPVFPLLQPVAMDELWECDRTSACKKALCSCFSLCLITPCPSRPVSAHVDVQWPKKFHISSPLHHWQQPIDIPQTPGGYFRNFWVGMCQSKVKQSKHGKFPSNCKASSIDFEMQISFHR